MVRQRERVFDVIAVVNLEENTLDVYADWNGRLERLPVGGMKFRRILVYRGLGDPRKDGDLLRAILETGGDKDVG